MARRACLSALALALVSVARAALVTLDNAAPRRDTDGDIITAGDGCISYQPDEQLYYLFGMRYQPCAEPDDGCYCGAAGCAANRCEQPGFVAPGTCCGWRNATIASWSSPDLVAWRKEGLDILPVLSADPSSQLSSNYGAAFEPCAVYNRRTRFWVLYFLRNGYTLASAVARTAAGPFDLVELDVPVPGYTSPRIVDFYFWQALSGELIMKHNGEGGEWSTTLSDDYLRVTNSSAIFGKELGYTEGGGIFQHNGDTFVMAGFGCCFCPLGSNGYLWRASDPLGSFELLGDFVPRYANHSAVTQAQQFSVTPVYTATGIVPMFIGIRFGSAPDRRKDHDYQYWFPLSFDAAGVMRNVSWVDSFQLDLAAPAAPPPPPPPPAPWYVCSYTALGACVEVPAGAPGASPACACAPQWGCAPAAPGQCAPVRAGTPGANATRAGCEHACAPVYVCSRAAPGTCEAAPAGAPGGAPTLAACEAACVECDLAGAWVGAAAGVRITIAQTRVNASAGAVVVSTAPRAWPNATGWAVPGALEVTGGWCGAGVCTGAVGPDARGVECGRVDWGADGAWTRAG